MSLNFKIVEFKFSILKNLNANYRNCNYIFFTKLHWSGDSKGTLRSSSQAATCPPVYPSRWRLHTVPLIAERQARMLWIPIFIVFGLTRSGMARESTVSVANTLSTQPLIGSISIVLGNFAHRLELNWIILATLWSRTGAHEWRFTTELDLVFEKD